RPSFAKSRATLLGCPLPCQHLWRQYGRYVRPHPRVRACRGIALSRRGSALHHRGRTLRHSAHETWYWAAIIVVRTAATNLGDLLCGDLHIFCPVVMTGLALALAVTVTLVWATTS